MLLSILEPYVRCLKLRKNKILDWYLTRKTGRNAEQRERIKWVEKNLNLRGSSVKEYFRNHNYVFEVNPDKFFNFWDPIGFEPVCKEYCWPALPSGECIEYIFNRGTYDYCSITNKWDFHFNGIAGEERVYVACNDPIIATEIRLKYS